MAKHQIITKEKNLTAKALAFFNPKGGVGKTTLSTQTAVAVQMNDYKVAFYDLDPQKTATHYFSTLTNKKYAPFFLSDNLEDEPPIGMKVVIIDCPPNLDFIPPKNFMIIAPTSSTSLDLHAYRKVLELEQLGYTVIKVINNFSTMRKSDKELLAHFKNCAVILGNSGITQAMSDGKTVWNSHQSSGRRAKNQFQYLLNCIGKGYAPELLLEHVMKIAYGGPDYIEKEKENKILEIENTNKSI